MVQCLESSDANALEGALDALYKARAPYGSPTPVVARCKVTQLCREESDGVFVESKAIVSLQIMQSVAAFACLTDWVLRPLRLDVHTLLHMTVGYSSCSIPHSTLSWRSAVVSVCPLQLPGYELYYCSRIVSFKSACSRSGPHRLPRNCG